MFIETLLKAGSARFKDLINLFKCRHFEQVLIIFVFSLQTQLERLCYFVNMELRN